MHDRNRTQTKGGGDRQEIRRMQGIRRQPQAGKNLRYGAKGNGVKWVQWHLNQCSEKLKTDGSFDPLTKAAVLRFQKKQRLTQDGIIGNKTRAALKKEVK